jgi:EF hand domain-containing protein
MSMSVGASSDALAYLQQLLQQGTAGASKSTGAADPLSELMQTLSGSGSDTDPSSTSTKAAGSGNSGSPPFGPGTMAQLLSLQGQDTTSPEQAFFSKLDTDGDGKISKTEFEDAASKAGVDSSVADAVFDKIDGDGDSDGSISQGELAKADHGGGHHHVHGGGGGGDGGGLDALMSGAGADGATTQTTTNADGSTTTTISYADGTSIDLNTPAAPPATTAPSSDNSNSGTSNKSNANLLEQLIKLQSQMLSSMTSTLSTTA